MRGLAGTLPLAATLGRRRFLVTLAAAGAATGCAGPLDPSIGATGDVYVALAKARAIAVLDPATDTEVARISLASLGQSSQPWRLGISPSGGAAVLPLKSTSSIGLVSAGGAATTRPNKRTSRAGDRRCEWVRVDSGQRAARAGWTTETVQALTADAAGRAYVLVGDGSGSGPSYAAVVDLESGAVARHVPLATAGESVLALQVSRDGARLFASIWRWEDSRAGPGVSPGMGRLVAIDTRDGRPLAQATMPTHSAVTDIALAAGPDGRAGALYASIATPGPSLDDDDAWYGYPAHYELAALEPGRLSTLAAWPLPHRPNATAVTPDGARAYLLSGSWSGGPWSMRLTSMDLATGAPNATWPLPLGCISPALAPTGKLYIADLLGDRLWRVDTRRDSFLGSVAQPGVPMAVAARE